MRITRPEPGARVSLGDINLATPELYVEGDAHLVWQTLRAERPLFRQARAGESFWAVTRYRDVRRVLSEHQTFTSERGTAINMLEGPDPAAGRMMHSTDPPRHYGFRKQLSDRFATRAMPEYMPAVASLVDEAMAPARDGEVWDVAASFARLPMAVGAMLMALPAADVDILLRLAYASLAPGDPHYTDRSARLAARVAHLEIIEYFTGHIAERRKRPGSDLISHLLAIEMDGSPLDDQGVLVNCLSLLLGAVVTTSHVISATLMTLMDQRGGEGRWPVDAPDRLFVEEALRWSSPVTHFMRRARCDVGFHGTILREGEAVTAWIASANRDGSVFDDPFTFDPKRTPNRHIGFGAGPHKCLGGNLARLMLQLSFGKLITTVAAFEAAGPVSHLVSNEIAGVVSLPLRLAFRSCSP
jgi:cytochrome P450